MKVGIYTFHAINNYGAMLQAYATQNALKKIGIESEIVNCYSREDERKNNYYSKPDNIKSIVKTVYAFVSPKIRLKKKRFEIFHNSMKLSKRYYSVDEIYNNPPQYDVHLVGSDQVWNLESGVPQSQKNLYFLDFLGENVRKASYASSFGNTDLALPVLSFLKLKLAGFYALSTRESSGVDLLEKVGLKAFHALDPTFLLNSDDWCSIMPSYPIIKRNYILYYGFDKSHVGQEMLTIISKYLKLPVVAVSANAFIPYKVDYYYQEAGPFEFLNLIKYSSYVITSSFHGMAFAINFRKDFVIMKHGTRMARMKSVLQQFNIHNRIVGSINELEELLEKRRHIDYENKEELIKRMILRSVSWLATVLQKESK